MEKLLTLDYITDLIPIRKSNSHKGSYGRVLIIASSHRYVGAGYISAYACMKSGSGLVTLAVESEIFSILSQKLNEAMVLDIDKYKSDFENLVKISNCIAIGPGMMKRRYTLDMIKFCLENASCPIVLDADALNILSENMDILANNDKKIVLTPHEGEFARLINADIAYIKENKKNLSMEFAKKYGVILILKGPETIITDGEDVYISNIGVPEMATGGMGDCLTGILASFTGQGLKLIDACNLAVYLHSYTANLLSKNMYSILATDISDKLPFVIKDIMIKNSIKY